MTAPGFAATSRALMFKQQMLTACQSLFTDGTLVCWGHPGTTYPRQVVALMDLLIQQTPATMGTQRSRTETLDLTVVFVASVNASDWRGQQTADEQSLAMLGQLEQHCRMTDTTVGGSVMWCALTDCTVEAFTPDAQTGAGWRSQVIAKFTAEARITG